MLVIHTGLREGRKKLDDWLDHIQHIHSQTCGLGQGSVSFLPVADVLSPGSQQARAQVKRRQILATPKGRFWSDIPDNLQHLSMPTPLKDES